MADRLTSLAARRFPPLFAVLVVGCAEHGAAPPNAPPAGAAPAAEVPLVALDPFPGETADEGSDATASAPPATQPTDSAPSCADLPSRDVLETWEVRSICQPGGGPRPLPVTKILDLGDGSFIFESRRECFRARYRKCFSK